jgi:spermidine synthase
MRLKTSPLNPGVDFIVTITDNSQNLDKKNVKTIAIVILYEMSQELVFQSNMSFDMMTHMLNVGRLITLQCALLNPMNMNEIAFELSEDIEKMRPAQFRDRISVQGWEDKNPKYLVDQGNTYLIRDCEEKPEQIFRQLYYTTDNNIINAIMAKIKIKYVSKSKIKNNNQYFPMETQDKFKNKGVIKCIDENNIPGFYEKSIICMAFYLDLDNFPKNTIKIMDIGAGLGIMSFYLYKLFKGNCEVDNIEKNKWIYEVGLKSFGLKNYYSNNNRINWFLEDAQTCMNKMIESYKNETKYENKIDFYDLIINEVNDIIPKEYCSPPVSNFTDEFLGNIKLLLKKNGVFIVNIQTRNFKVLYENYKQIDKYFPTCCVIPSESSLCYIFICFNQILSEESYSERFQINKEKILKGNVIDSNLVEPFYRDVISKIKSVKEEIKKMEDNSKKI